MVVAGGEERGRGRGGGENTPPVGVDNDVGANDGTGGDVGGFFVDGSTKPLAPVAVPAAAAVVAPPAVLSPSVVPMVVALLPLPLPTPVPVPASATGQGLVSEPFLLPATAAGQGLECTASETSFVIYNSNVSILYERARVNIYGRARVS